ncbi:MAG: hypothetical protein WD342_15800 [Verrucomicrobiales bacterium]
MKVPTTVCLALLLSGAVPAAKAEIVEREVRATGTPGTPGATSAYVMQGSRNMKRQGKRRTTSSVAVPPLFLDSRNTPAAVIPALATPQLEPKPRFGYGSDWTPEPSDDELREPEPAPEPSQTSQLVPYRFKRPYSSTEYWPVVYHYGHPFRHAWHAPFGCGSSFFYSRSSVWLGFGP